MSSLEGFRKVHRATPFLRIWTIIVAALAAFAFNSGASVLSFIWGVVTGEYGFAVLPILLTVGGAVIVVALAWISPEFGGKPSGSASPMKRCSCNAE